MMGLELKVKSVRPLSNADQKSICGGGGGGAGGKGMV